MSTNSAPSKKGIDAAWNDRVDLITGDVIQRLEDEPGDGYRFAAVAKRRSTFGASYALHFPVTTVLYVDTAGRYGFERTFFGVRDDWQNVPRTMAVDGDTDVPLLPPHRQRAVRPLLDHYDGVEIDP